jgi:hypothetical protein
MARAPLSEEARRLRLAFDLHEFGLDMMVSKLRREHPGEDDDAIYARLNTWLRSRSEQGEAGNNPA